MSLYRIDSLLEWAELVRRLDLGEEVPIHKIGWNGERVALWRIPSAPDQVIVGISDGGYKTSSFQTLWKSGFVDNGVRIKR